MLSDTGYSTPILANMLERLLRDATFTESKVARSPWIKPRLGGAAIDGGNAADEPTGL
jgi:hypothetical protein